MNIGTRIKELRLKNNLTQKELGDRCELTKGFISQLENNLTTPSIDTLKDIIVVLGSTFGEFFEETEDEQVVFGKDDYFVKKSTEDSVTWLVPSAQKNEMEPILVTINPRSETQPDMPHEGEEFGYVLSGKVRLVLGKKKFVVKKGETFYFKADKKHYLINNTDMGATVLWISAPPNF